MGWTCFFWEKMVWVAFLGRFFFFLGGGYKGKNGSLWCFVFVGGLWLLERGLNELVKKANNDLNLRKNRSKTGWNPFPGVTKECFLEALKYFKASKKHPFEIPGSLKTIHPIFFKFFAGSKISKKPTPLCHSAHGPLAVPEGPPDARRFGPRG